jgi:cystathionine beta-lyase/cystathionine gamma-synthase
MAAITALSLALLKSGDHVVCGDVVYGGTVRLYQQVLEQFGVEATFVDTSDLDKTAAAFKPNTRLAIIETPANPTLKLTDIAAVSKIAKDKGAIVAVDNTFLTAYLQRPLELGADIVVYSTTKYIEGHNSVIGGAVLTNDAAILEKIKFVQNAVGFAQAPFDAWLTLRGLKTLPLRLARHSENAQAIAEYLEEHQRVTNVAYPGLKSFKQYDLAVKQQRGHGGMLAFEIEGGLEAGKRVATSVRLIQLAESLGAVESLLTHPASMTHVPIPRAQRLATGITDGLLRLSVGLETAKDLITDLDQALASAYQ